MPGSARLLQLLRAEVPAVPPVVAVLQDAHPGRQQNILNVIIAKDEP
jgi:hypothetical protein